MGVFWSVLDSTISLVFYLMHWDKWVLSFIEMNGKCGLGLMEKRVSKPSILKFENKTPKPFNPLPIKHRDKSSPPHLPLFWRLNAMRGHTDYDTRPPETSNDI